MTQTVDDLLRKNLETFGERDAKKRRAIMATIWAADGVFIDPDGPHLGPQAIDEAIERILLKFPDFVFSELSAPDSHNGIARIIHIFEDNKSLLCYKHVVQTMFAVTKEASECLTIAQHSVCCSQEFFASL